MYLKMAMAAWHQEGWSIVERSGHMALLVALMKTQKASLRTGESRLK
ncbi:hypothetical protein ACIPT2_20105 [Pectobacterium brasiliense]